MLNNQQSSIHQSPKCFVTYGSMGHIDPKQPPHKGKPWNALMAQDFIHKLDLIIPKEAYAAIHKKVVEDEEPPCYSRVTMTLCDILSGEFFTEYIKKGNIIMLSEGKITAGNLFTLRDGTLTMYLDKETYERTGLEGKPYSAKGARGLRSRWTVTFDLRSPSMLHGKRGFDRLVYACKNALNESKTWLFCNVDGIAPHPDPLQKNFPTRFTSSPGKSKEIITRAVVLGISPNVLVNGDRSGLEDEAAELYEWLSLIRLGSPRIESSDTIDPYLARYSAPDDAGEAMVVYRLTWQGFMSTSWVRGLLMNILSTCTSDSWFSISTTCFNKSLVGNSDELVLLRPPSADGRYLAWEIKSSN